MIAALWVVLWVGVFGFLSWHAREKKGQCRLAGTMALAPICQLGSLFALGLAYSASIEAILAIYLMAATIGLAIAIVLSAPLRALWINGKDYQLTAFALGLFGLAIAPIHTSLLNVKSEGWFALGIVALFDFMVAGLVLPGVVTLKRPTMVLYAVPAMLSAATFYWKAPDIAFKSRNVLSPMNSMQEAGARRALQSGTRDQRSAMLALARDGDQKLLDQLVQELRQGQIDTDYAGNLTILLDKRPSDSAVREAVTSALQRSVAGYRPDNSFDDSDRKVEMLLEAIATTKDTAALPSLKRAYDVAGGNINIRHAAIKGLAPLQGPEADRLKIKILNEAHPPYDREVAKFLVSGASPAVAKAIDAFGRRLVEFDKNRKLKDRRVQDLAAAGATDELVRRATSRAAHDQGAATIALIKLKHPARIKLALAARISVAMRGSELRGHSDPELARAVVARLKSQGKTPDRLLARFLSEWGPPEAASMLGSLLWSINSMEAAFSLSRIGGADAAALLLARWRSVRESESYLEFGLIAALGKMRAKSAFLPLVRAEEKEGLRPAVVSDGVPIYTSDMAAWALGQMDVPEAKRIFADHQFKGDVSAIEKWVSAMSR